MNYQNVFKRYELKYILDKQQYEIIRSLLDKYMEPDEFGKSTIYNLYFDTPSFLLIRNSIERPVYKEKLRVRSYGLAKEDSTVFIELKKKYDSVVYKRRISATYEMAMNYLLNNVKFEDTQISREIDYFLELYKGLRPTEIISYDRCAFYEKGNRELRVTFDTNILGRDYDLSLTSKIEGNNILDDKYVLMEIKTGMAIPMWLCRELSRLKIYKTTFSKYGTAYINNQGGNLNDRQNICRSI